MAIDLGGNSNKVIISVEVDSATGETKLNSLDDKLNSLGETTDRGSLKFTEFASALEIAQIALEAVGTAVQLIPDLAERGEGVQDLADSFTALGGSEIVISNTSQALGGLVTNTDLLKSANSALLGGIPDFNSNFELLATTAQKLSNTLGIDTTQALDQLVNGLVKAQDRQLQLMGVNVDATAINEAYANSVGKQVSELTELEKKQAFQVEALKQISELNQRLPGEGESVANSFDQIDEIAKGVNSSEELARALREVAQVIHSIDWKQIADGVAYLINKFIELTSFTIDLVGWLKELHDIGKGGFIDKATIKNLEDFSKISESLPQSLNEINQAISNIKTKSDLESVKKQFIELTKAVYGSETATKEYGNIITALSKKLSEVEVKEKSLAGATGQTNKIRKESNKEIENQVDQSDDYLELIEKITEAYKDNEISATSYNEIIKELGENIIQFGNDAEKAMRKAEKATDEARKKAEKTKDAWGQLLGTIGQNVEYGGVNLGDIFTTENDQGNSISDWISEQTDMSAEQLGVLGTVFSGVMNMIAGGEGAPESGSFGDYLAYELQRGKDEMEGFFEMAGALVGTFLGSTEIGAKIGKFIGAFLFSSIDQDMAAEYTKALNGWLESVFQNINLDSDILGEKLINNLANVMGILESKGKDFFNLEWQIQNTGGFNLGSLNVNDMATQMGDQFNIDLLNMIPKEKWVKFYEEFGKNLVSIADKLGELGIDSEIAQEIQQTVMYALEAGLTPAEMIQVLAEKFGDIIPLALEEVNAQMAGQAPITFLEDVLDITPELKEQFEGIGIAMASMFAGADEDLQKIIAYFQDFLMLTFQNVEGLNELQMLLEASGASQEQAESALQEMYLNGKITLDQYRQALANIRDLYAEGIPGAVGATNLAMENLTEHGLSNGRQGWDALKDLAAEALEAGASSLGDLSEMLKAQGMDAGQVAKIMEALSKAGVTTLDQLGNLSLEHSALILSILKDLGYQFDTIKEESEDTFESNSQGVENFGNATVETTTDVEDFIASLEATGTIGQENFEQLNEGVATNKMLLDESGESVTDLYNKLNATPDEKNVVLRIDTQDGEQSETTQMLVSAFQGKFNILGINVKPQGQSAGGSI